MLNLALCSPDTHVNFRVIPAERPGGDEDARVSSTPIDQMQHRIVRKPSSIQSPIKLPSALVVVKVAQSCVTCRDSSPIRLGLAARARVSGK